jgi:tripartite-type tricarboxylate transporter receptor subunit TctC
MSTSSARRRLRRQLAVALSALLTVGWSFGSACAQGPAAAFPARVIRIVPFGTAGGPIDAIARLYAEKLQQRWGQTVIVEPRPGASGILAADTVAKAAPDGYTILITLALTHINNAILMPKLPYDPVKDFTPLSQLATGGPMLVARADAPYSDLASFVAFARRHPGLTYGTWGNGSQAHLFGELLKRQTGLNLTHVPYKAEAPAHLDMAGGVLDFAWANPATARTQTQAGKLKVLGITGTRRVSTMPEIATFTEQGFKGFDLDSWIGAYGPANLPAAIAAQWVDALRDITASAEIRDKLASYGFEPLGNDPKEFVANYQSDLPRVAELIKAAGVTAQ